MGMYSADEPRYADIGRAMAQSGDWITPRLWGAPWFEKPALLYWMTASGFKLGLGTDLAPRLPVALLSVAFLAFFWWRLGQVFDESLANCSVAILATTAGWLAYSHVAVTDLPLTAFFSMAVLFSLPQTGSGARPSRTAAAAAFGLAMLTKSLPPLVLFLPGPGARLSQLAPLVSFLANRGLYCSRIALVCDLRPSATAGIFPMFSSSNSSSVVFSPRHSSTANHGGFTDPSACFCYSRGFRSCLPRFAMRRTMDEPACWPSWSPPALSFSLCRSTNSRDTCSR